jgi:predicted ArsR family transcriptional regulator
LREHLRFSSPITNNFANDHKQLLTAQVLQKDEIDQLVVLTKEQSAQLAAETEHRRAKDAVLDARVDKLVSAIGDLVQRLPVR